jgi:creatinine amidohydrolase
MKLKPILASMMLLASPVQAQTANAVYMENMTWQEIRDRVAAGGDIVIVPTGGTQQNGPHMATGAHTVIAKYTAVDIAHKLPGTLVAPVIPYTVSGRINPPEGDMQFSGTIALRQEVYEAVLEDVATSLKQHGFHLICFLGDSDGANLGQQRVAAKLTAAWAAQGVRVINLDAYSRKESQLQWAQSMGAMTLDPMAKAGMAQTAQLMAINPVLLRTSLIGAYTERDYATTGAAGDATQATAANGKGFLGVKIDAAVRQIKEATQRTY